MAYPDVTALWRNAHALRSARERALDVARRQLAQRQDTQQVDTQVMGGSHSASLQMELYREQIAPVVDRLPQSFAALEIGAGMAWSAARLAAEPKAGHVLATEPHWSGMTPYALHNVFSLARLAQSDAALARVLSFERDAEGNVTSVALPPNLLLAAACGSALPASDSSRDFVYSINCLEHIPDLEGTFTEAARVMKQGALLYCSSQPLFLSRTGHHIDDIFPLPWGHLLWQPEELAEVVLQEAGSREWAPGEPLQTRHVLSILRDEINHASPHRIRTALRHGPWGIEGWVDLTDPADEALAAKIGLREAIAGIPYQDLFLTGLRFCLRREQRPTGLRLPLRLGHQTRRRLARLLGRPCVTQRYSC